MTDDELACALAQACGALLLQVRSSGLLAGQALGDAGDAVAQVMLARVLAHHRPDDAVLSEEAADDAARLSAARTWVVDPLDGTREYAEGREDWAVHVGLVEGGAPTACAVALPARDLVLSAATATGAPRAAGPLRLAVSRSRAPELVALVAADLDAELVPMGSAGVKAMAVVSGEVDVYLHAGGQYQWDSCAPVGVARAAGLHTSRIDGSPLVYNEADPWLPDLLICRPEIAARVLRSVADHREESVA